MTRQPAYTTRSVLAGDAVLGLLKVEGLVGIRQVLVLLPVDGDEAVLDDHLTRSHPETL